LEKKISKFSAPQHLVEVENLIGLEEKKFQNFPPHHSCLRQKFYLMLKKKISKFSAPQHLVEAEILLRLGEKNFQNFPPHHSCLRRKF
jgi:hypothetical protein